MSGSTIMSGKYCLMSAGMVLSLAVAAGPAAAQSTAVKPSGAKAAAGWQALAVDDWQPREAADLMDVEVPAYKGFPESAEGKPSLSVEISRAPKGPGFAAVVTKKGLLDDAIGAEQIRLGIEYRDGKWHVVRGERRWQCRRGIMAGGWTASRCP
jgi:hypothetical protein